MLHNITREIGIDVGHRVPDHGSKCRNLHGHRYTVQATCRGPLFQSGEQKGMVLDFGFLKEEMMDWIDAPCDHGTVLYVLDPILLHLLDVQNLTCAGDKIDQMARDTAMYGPSGMMGDAVRTKGVENTKLYVVPFIPTAENLAAHWFTILHPRVDIRSEGKAKLHDVRVWETPNCQAVYPA